MYFFDPGTPFELNHASRFPLYVEPLSLNIIWLGAINTLNAGISYNRSNNNKLLL